MISQEMISNDEIELAERHIKRMQNLDELQKILEMI